MPIFRILNLGNEVPNLVSEVQNALVFLGLTLEIPATSGVSDPRLRVSDPRLATPKNGHFGVPFSKNCFGLPNRNQGTSGGLGGLSTSQKT